MNIKTKETMNVHAKNGDKVKFTNPKAGYDSDIEKTKKYLKLGEVYTIEKTEVDSWFTHVWLKEIPEVYFNSVHFIDYTPKEEIENVKVKVTINPREYFGNFAVADQEITFIGNAFHVRENFLNGGNDVLFVALEENGEIIAVNINKAKIERV